jgi:hypothetical protein
VMIMRQLAQVGGICSLKAANLRQLSSPAPIGSTGETAASTTRRPPVNAHGQSRTDRR